MKGVVRASCSHGNFCFVPFEFPTRIVGPYLSCSFHNPLFFVVNLFEDIFYQGHLPGLFIVNNFPQPGACSAPVWTCGMHPGYVVIPSIVVSGVFSETDVGATWRFYLFEV